MAGYETTSQTLQVGCKLNLAVQGENSRYIISGELRATDQFGLLLQTTEGAAGLTGGNRDIFVPWRSVLMSEVYPKNTQTTELIRSQSNFIHEVFQIAQTGNGTPTPERERVSR